MQDKDWQFVAGDWRQTLAMANPADFVYLDPPYIGRHADYFNTWNAQEAAELAEACRELPCGYALSMWKENKYRQNAHLAEHWAEGEMRTWSHFYHVGPSESLRNAMTEAHGVRPELCRALTEEQRLLRSPSG